MRDIAKGIVIGVAVAWIVGTLASRQRATQAQSSTPPPVQPSLHTVPYATGPIYYV